MSSRPNELFKLIQSAYICKRTIKKSLKHDADSPTYALAKFYDEHFTALEKVHSITISEVNELMNQLDTHRIENIGAEEAQLLLSHICTFLESLKPLIGRKLA